MWKDIYDFNIKIEVKDILIPILTGLIIWFRRMIGRLFWHAWNKRKEDYIIGKWFLYHYTIHDGSVKLKVNEVKIYKAVWLAKHQIKFYGDVIIDRQKQRVLYKGSVKKEGANYILEFKSNNITSHETFVLRMKDVFHDKSVPIPGTYSGVDFNAHPYVTVCFLMQTRFPKETEEVTFKELLKRYSGFCPEERFIGIYEAVDFEIHPSIQN